MMEAKVTLATLLRKFRVQSMDKEDNLALLCELVLRPKNGLKIKLFDRITDT